MSGQTASQDIKKINKNIKKNKTKQSVHSLSININVFSLHFEVSCPSVWLFFLPLLSIPFLFFDNMTDWSENTPQDVKPPKNPPYESRQFRSSPVQRLTSTRRAARRCSDPTKCKEHGTRRWRHSVEIMPHLMSRIYCYSGGSWDGWLVTVRGLNITHGVHCYFAVVFFLFFLTSVYVTS